MRRSWSAIYQTGISKVKRRESGTYNGELDIRWAFFRANLVDILDPGLVRIEVVSRETNDLDTTSGKIGGTTSDLSEFSCTNLGRSESEVSERFDGRVLLKC